MYIQEGYSLSCDALTTAVKVTKDPVEVDLSWPKTLSNETSWLSQFTKSQIHLILKESEGLVQSPWWCLKYRGFQTQIEGIFWDLGIHGTTWWRSTSWLWPRGIFIVWVLVCRGGSLIWRFNLATLFLTPLSSASASTTFTFPNFSSFSTLCSFDFMISLPSRSWTANPAITFLSTRTWTPGLPWSRTPRSGPAPRSWFFPRWGSRSGAGTGEGWCCSRRHLGDLLVLVVEQVGRVVLPLVRVVVVSLSQLGQLRLHWPQLVRHLRHLKFICEIVPFSLVNLLNMLYNTFSNKKTKCLHQWDNGEKWWKYFGIMKTSHGFHFLSYQLFLVEHFCFHLGNLLQKSRVKFNNPLFQFWGLHLIFCNEFPVLGWDLFLKTDDLLLQCVDLTHMVHVRSIVPFRGLNKYMIFVKQIIIV